MLDETMRFRNTGWDIKELSNEIAQKLVADGYDVQSNYTKGNMVIQARKACVLRDIVTANRAFTIAITGRPSDFSVKVGVGKMIQNLGVAAAEAILISELFLAVDVPEMLWTQYVHNGIVKEIERTVGARPSRRTLGKGRAVSRAVGEAGGKSKYVAQETGKDVVKFVKRGGREIKKSIEAIPGTN